jgi:hypothetical protein
MLKSAVLLAITLVLTVCVTVSASRPYTSTETIVKRTPVLIEGTLTRQKQVESPSTEYILYQTKTAFQLKLTKVKSWKPQPFSKSISVYSRILAESPCTGISIENDKRYIILGQFDSSRKILMTDLCGAVIDSSSISGIDIKKTIVSIYGQAS